MSRRSDSGRLFFGCFGPGVADQHGCLLRSRSFPFKGSDAERSVMVYNVFDDEGNKVDVLQRIVPNGRACMEEVSLRPLNDGTSKRLLRATKAAFLDMSLVRKVRKKMNPKERNGQLCKEEVGILRSERSEEPRKSNFDFSSSTQSSFAATPLSSTGSTRSLSPESSTNTLDHGVSKLLARRVSSDPKCYCLDRRPVSLANTYLCLILLAMTVLIFWGKVCAIVCTSACLVFSLSSPVAARSASS